MPNPTKPNEKTIIKKLQEIQSKLKAPKNQVNNFGKYKYRSCEDILEAVKPHLEKHELVLAISDEVVSIDGRFYVKATAEITNGKERISSSAFAREEESKKGMDGAQITGAASSYARKYALNGLLAIDDAKDADTKDNSKPFTEIKKINDEQKEAITNLYSELEITPENWAKTLKLYNVSSVDNLTAMQAGKLIEQLEKKKEANNLNKKND